MILKATHSVKWQRRIHLMNDFPHLTKGTGLIPVRSNIGHHAHWKRCLVERHQHLDVDIFAYVHVFGVRENSNNFDVGYRATVPAHAKVISDRITALEVSVCKVLIDHAHPPLGFLHIIRLIVCIGIAKVPAIEYLHSHRFDITRCYRVKVWRRGRIGAPCIYCREQAEEQAGCTRDQKRET